MAKTMMVHIDTTEENNAFRAVLLKDIPYFHKLYAKYHDPKWLEIARDLGKAVNKLSITK